jgi:hypothetical protein
MYAVRIHYPGRKGKAGKRDLVVPKATRAQAVAYARKVAKRGFVYARGRGRADLLGRKPYGAKKGAPVACVYNLGKWGAKPTCFKAGRPGYYHEPVIVETPYFGGRK